MQYLSHQIKYGEKVKKKLMKRGYVYLVAPPRAGKTMTALYAVENIDAIKNVLVITKKNAFSGWTMFTDKLSKNYTIINKESIHKIDTSEMNVVILDECHTLGGLGKPTSTHLKLKDKLWQLPQILISATPFVESKNHIYYQMTKSKYNPFRKYKNFYDFFRAYGKEDKILVYEQWVETYKKSKKELNKLIDKITVEMPKTFDINTTDKLHYIELSKKQKEVYNILVKEGYYYEYLSLCCKADSEPLEDDGDVLGECSKCKKYGVLLPYEMTADSTLKLRTLLHQIEGGVVKCDNEDYYEFEQQPKIEYIKEKFGDKPNIGIMVHFRQERDLIRKYLKNVTIYSSNADAEGVDLSHLEAFIIYSQDYSGAKHIQRRDRIVNVNGSKTLDVHYLLVKKGISEQVYTTCNDKRNFNNETFKKIKL